MKVKVNETCMGCGYCVANCPKYFDFNEDGFSEAIKTEVEENDEKEVKAIADGCPVSAIVVEEKED